MSLFTIGIHSDSLETKLDRIISLLESSANLEDRLDRIIDSLAILEDTMNTQLEALSQQVQQSTDVERSAVALIQGIADRIAAAGVDQTKLNALRASLKASADALAAAVAANTEVDSGEPVPPVSDPMTGTGSGGVAEPAAGGVSDVTPVDTGVVSGDGTPVGAGSTDAPGTVPVTDNPAVAAPADPVSAPDAGLTPGAPVESDAVTQRRIV